MRKLIILIAVGALLLFPPAALAADSLYRMLNADEVESFKADQDAIIVGQLTGKKDDMYTVKVIKVISGTVKPDSILVSSDFAYGFGQTAMKPEINHYCVMSLKKAGSYYKNAWGVFKASSGDYRTLKLLSEDISYYQGMGDIAAIEWYVNSGGTEKDFYFRESAAYVKRPNGEDIKIYPKEQMRTEQITPKNSSTIPGFPVGKVTIASAAVLGLMIILAVIKYIRKTI